MKNIILILVAAFTVSIGFSQVSTDVIYKSTSEPISYIKFLEDGTVLYTDSDLQGIDISKVLTNNTEPQDKIVIIKSKANGVKGSKASFVIQNGTVKHNCIAIANGDELDVVMMGPGGKKQVHYKVLSK